eukprot:6790081-Pyramimonas_sp.AAC.1
MANSRFAKSRTCAAETHMSSLSCARRAHGPNSVDISAIEASKKRVNSGRLTIHSGTDRWSEGGR